MVGYLRPAFGGRVKPMRLWGPTGQLYGPTGVSRIAKNLMEAFSDDIRIRMADEHVPEVGTQIEAHDFTGDSVVFEEGGVKITAYEVNHGPLIKPACGYRIDYAGRSVTISGDTKFDENVIKYGTGVDLLIHEVCAMPAAQELPGLIRTCMARTPIGGKASISARDERDPFDGKTGRRHRAQGAEKGR